jgi:RNA-directed DNA polymerase
VKMVMERLGLEMHPEKTRMVELTHGKESFTFLGWTVRKRRSVQRNPRWHFVQRWPSPKAMKRIRERVHEMTDVRGRQAQNIGELIERLNPVLRGWGNYFRTGNAEREFRKVDEYVHDRILRWQWRRGGQRTRFRFDRWPRKRLHDMGLHRLQGTVRYPQAATPRKHSQENSSVSCVREIRTHSLKGGAGNGTP